MLKLFRNGRERLKLILLIVCTMINISRSLKYTFTCIYDLNLYIYVFHVIDIEFKLNISTYLLLYLSI